MRLEKVQKALRNEKDSTMNIRRRTGAEVSTLCSAV